MGNSFLEEPITTKTTTWGEDQHLKYSVCEMQGWRTNMEDAYIAEKCIDLFPSLALFAVFDGHGGGEVARYCADHFIEHFVKRKSLTEGRIGDALKETFMQLEIVIKTKPAIEEMHKNKSNWQPNSQPSMTDAGCTANVVVITDSKIICANAGDSRSTICRGKECIALSTDHKPENPVEKERIEKTGVPIVQGRVNGLNLTRSIGDFKHKTVAGLPFHKQPIICVPDILEVSRDSKDEFILVGCDGLWERYGDDHIKLTLEMQELLKKQHGVNSLKRFFDKNIGKSKTDGPYGMDNMTGIIVQFKS